MIHYKFSRSIDRDFARILRERVNTYFTEHDLSRNANAQMVWKTIAVYALYVGPFLLMLLTGMSNIWLMFLLWALMGIGKASIGTAVMHDALHGSYSRFKAVNYIMGMSAVVLGADPDLWKIQHNVLHHTYTNIEDADEDIEPRFLFRFSPHQQRRWFHRYQHLYAPIFYSLSTLLWIVHKDFVKPFDYRRKGLIKSNGEVAALFAKIFVRKAVYLFIFLVVPILVLPVAPWLIFLMFVTMHLVSGFLLSIIFQSAHVVPDTHFTRQEDEEIEQSWFVHQIASTANFSSANKVVAWLIGGLNMQIEHHLFTDICHVHYPRLAGIVRKTAAEFNIPYNEQGSFIAAVRNHFALLRKLGRSTVVISQPRLTVSSLD